MNIGIYADNTLPLDVRKFCEVLNGLCRTVTFIPGQTQFRLQGDVIKSPSSDATLPKNLVDEASQFALSCLATNVAYDNNHFFDTHGSNTIISFSGWNFLTDLPIANGFAYFIASILTDTYGIGKTHDSNTGCVNDFWWDKTGVDLGMRAAFICGDCFRSYTGRDPIIDDIRAILNGISIASRGGEDLLEAPLPDQQSETGDFDTFLCHNSEDKPAVRAIYEALNAAGIRSWLDEEQLPPGMPWQTELEKAIESIRCACVFVGPSGMGPWQRNEIRAFLEVFDAENRPVIPVLLPDAGTAPSLPIFLRQRTWVDLRERSRSSLDRLIAHLKQSRLI